MYLEYLKKNPIHQNKNDSINDLFLIKKKKIKNYLEQS